MAKASKFHKAPFDEPTLTKLELYRQYLREWFPVFVSSVTQRFRFIYVFDFFVDQGTTARCLLWGHI